VPDFIGSGKGSVADSDKGYKNTLDSIEGRVDELSHSCFLEKYFVLNQVSMLPALVV
jgi:hypothetical protein